MEIHFDGFQAMISKIQQISSKCMNKRYQNLTRNRIQLEDSRVAEPIKLYISVVRRGITVQFGNCTIINFII